MRENGELKFLFPGILDIKESQAGIFLRYRTSETVLGPRSGYMV